MTVSGNHARLQRLHDFGTNSGELGAVIYAPARLARGCPLVVVLHGSTQDAEAYDAGSGWSRLADEYGFALLFPEQQRRNSASLGFHWFEPKHNARDVGEGVVDPADDRARNP